MHENVRICASKQMLFINAKTVSVSNGRVVAALLIFICTHERPWFDSHDVRCSRFLVRPCANTTSMWVHSTIYNSEANARPELVLLGRDTSLFGNH